MPYSVKNKLNVLNIMEYLSLNDLGLTIAVYKFYDLSNSYNAAEYLFQEAQQQTDVNRKYHLLKEAIVGFNSCYDYTLQVVYFAFDFFEKVESAQDYENIIQKECVSKQWLKDENGKRVYKDSVFFEDIKSLKSSNPDAKSFFDNYTKFHDYVFDVDNGIRRWANNIKHQGGFVASEILEKDNVAYVNCLIDNEIVFTTEWLYPLNPSFEEIMMRLKKQSENLMAFINWLFDSIFGDTRTIDFKSKKLFSAGKCKQYIKSSMIVPMQKHK